MANSRKSIRTSPTRRSPGLLRRRDSFLKGKLQRRLHAEQLETRVLLAGDLHNWDDPFDTDANGMFTPADILHVINQINAQSSSASASTAGGESVVDNGFPSAPVYYKDVNGDGLVSPIDALHTINDFNARNAEGTSTPLVRYRVSAVTPGTNNAIAGP